MRLQKLKFEHLQQMAEIEKEAFKAPWSVNMFIPELASDEAVYLVGTEDEEVVCYGGFHKIFDEGHIMNIAVKDNHRKQGLGRELINALIARAKLLGINRMTLEVSEKNIAAINLYSSFGFENCGIRKNYYADGSNAFIMWKNL